MYYILKDDEEDAPEDVKKAFYLVRDAIDAASNAYDLMVIPYFKMHHLYGNLYGIYSLSVDNKKSKWRMLIKCLNENDEWVKSDPIGITFEFTNLLSDSNGYSIGTYWKDVSTSANSLQH